MGRLKPLFWRRFSASWGLALAALAQVAWADEWPPVTPADLKMTAEPKAPGANAIFLYRQVDRDDSNASERTYVRIKILTPEGREQGNVQIEFQNGETVRGIEARTIRFDGSVANFDGTVYEKTLLSARNVKVLAKTFTMPEVEVGSIIEYRYTRRFIYGYVYDSHWILSQPLFTRYGKFSLLPSTNFALRWSWPRGLPPGTPDPKKERDSIRLDSHDIPAFVTEEFMPPEEELKYRVDFIYEDASSFEKDPVDYWKKFSRRSASVLKDQQGKLSTLQQAVAQIVQPADSTDTRLRRIYARVQQIHNLSYGQPRSEQENARESPDAIRTADDVLAQGRGNALQINVLFMSLVRAAGFEADFAYVATRDRYFFDYRLMNSRQLNSSLVIVKVDGQDRFFDPGSPYIPFGMLPWYSTVIEALRIDGRGGTWITTPISIPAASRIERHATFTLDRGTLRGKATFTFTGLEAAWRRRSESTEDETARKQFLENQIEYSIPSGIHAKLTNAPDWDGADTPLVAEYEVEVPGWAAYVGRRQLLPMGVFSNEEKHAFEHATRIQPMYFDFPNQHDDDVTIELPVGMRPSSIPKSSSIDRKVLTYSTSVDAADRSLHLQRSVSLNMTLVDPKFYGQVRDFYQTVRAADEEQIVLSADADAAAR
jgi:transglutaminase-like putative cysteine protease